ncbi:MAG: glycosyltransferase, partial [Nitrospiria bacterium]
MSRATSTEAARRSTSSLKGKKILSIYYQHKPGGLCKRLYMMFEALTAQGAEVHYIAVAPYPVTHPKLISHILWTPFKHHRGLLFWCYFALTAPFYAFVIGRRTRIDLVSVFGGVYGFFALFLKLFSQTPVLTFVRADSREIGRILKRPPLLIALEDTLLSLSLKMSQKIVAVSAPLKENISARYGIAPEKVLVLENNISDLSRNAQSQNLSRKKLGFDNKAFIIFTMGVLDQRKNIDVLIQAAAYLDKHFILLIAGEGPEKPRLEKMVHGLQSEVKIVFTGWLRDVSDYLNAATLFVLPSKHEGCPNALLEALSF